MRIAHVAAWTRDLEAAAAFWRDHFGAGIGTPYRSERRPGFRSIFVSLPEGPTIELMTGPWVEADAGRPEREGWAHLAVSLGSEGRVDHLADRLEKAGLLVSRPRTTGDGFYEAVARMPDGSLVEITS